MIYNPAIQQYFVFSFQSRFQTGALSGTFVLRISRVITNIICILITNTQCTSKLNAVQSVPETKFYRVCTSNWTLCSLYQQLKNQFSNLKVLTVFVQATLKSVQSVPAVPAPSAFSSAATRKNKNIFIQVIQHFKYGVSHNSCPTDCRYDLLDLNGQSIWTLCK